MSTDPSLQPLRIPEGWSVNYNVWREIDPEQAHAWDWLLEDLMQLGHQACCLLVDVGWYGGEAGHFTAVVHRGSFSGPELERFSSRNRLELAATVENWLANPQSLGQLDNANA